MAWRYFAASREAIHVFEVLGHGEKQRDGMLGGRDGRRVGRIADGDPARSGVWNYDVVEADTATRDHA